MFVKISILFDALLLVGPSIVSSAIASAALVVASSVWVCFLFLLLLLSRLSLRLLPFVVLYLGPACCSVVLSAIVSLCRPSKLLLLACHFSASAAALVLSAFDVIWVFAPVLLLFFFFPLLSWSDVLFFGASSFFAACS